MMTPVLTVENLKTFFRSGGRIARAVDGVSFSINAGETFALVGESGCGKSVTALSILRLIPEPAGWIEGGSIRLGDKDLLSLAPPEMREIRGNGISMIFQEPMTALNPVFTVGNQVAEAVLAHPPSPSRQLKNHDTGIPSHARCDDSMWPAWLRRIPLARSSRELHQHISWKQAQEKTVELFRRVGISDPGKRGEDYPHQMSGGMRQRVMIAMALACRPSVLIADEPTTALDVTIQAQILDLVRDLRKELGMAVLLITHDMGVVKENADRVGVMYAGRLVEEASREELFRNPSHPYTQLLLRSLPSRAMRGQALASIGGMVPPATDYPEGCRFHPRCPHAMDVCRKEEPGRFAAGEDHYAGCFLLDNRFRDREAGAATKTEKQVVSTPDLSAVRLEVTDLVKHFPIRRGVMKKVVGQVRAVDGVSFRVCTGETLALVGESGCGKTTVGKCIVRLNEPTSGAIKFHDVELCCLSRHKLKTYRQRIQMLFQDPFASLNPRQTIGEIIAEGMAAHEIGEGKQDRNDRIAEMMGKVGLSPDTLGRYPHQFSGGQRQRIGLARALAVGPELVICDEATSSLDVSVQAQILNLLRRLQAEMGLSYLFITHDLSVVKYLADRVAVMYLGRIVEEGTRDEIFADPRHPYTRALLSAVPQVDEESGLKRIVLGGDVPSPVNPPAGCHFHPRCPSAMPECSQAYPGAMQISPTHFCKCLLCH